MLSRLNLRIRRSALTRRARSSPMPAPSRTMPAENPAPVSGPLAHCRGWVKAALISLFRERSGECGGKAMADTVGQRVHRYLLDGSDEDLKRLLAVSERMSVPTRTALRRSGIQAGWAVIDCGCGPLGGLLDLAELAGPAGRVVGVDASLPAVERARLAVAAVGLGNVEVVAGDVNDLAAGAVGGPFDLAFTRLFLLHQPDPVHTLRQIASLLRPGGWIVAQEPLGSPAPRSFPHLPALDAFWELMFRLGEGLGAAAQGVEQLPGSAAAAGLQVVRMD